MEDYELTIGAIEFYKDKACGMICSNCDKCEAMYKYNDKSYCCFDTVIRFIKYVNKYRT